MPLVNAKKKQPKIRKFFQKKATNISQDFDNCDELREEIEQLEKTLKAKQDEMFQLLRNSYRQKLSPVKNKNEPILRADKIILGNSIDSLKRDLELMSMLTGIEVQSYIAGDHCAIVYHLQHNNKHEVKHGLRIDMTSGDNLVSQTSLPLGFNLKAVLEDFDNVMVPNCLVSVRKALVAYYDRLDQFQALKKLLNIEAQLVKNMDATHIEICFSVRSDLEADDEFINVTLMLDYRLYDIRTKQYSFIENDLPEESIKVLKQQCIGFKREPLDVAFKDAFIDGVGRYSMLKQYGPQPTEVDHQFRRRQKRRRPPQQYYNNDDTFRPEDCSDTDDDVEE